MRAADHALFLMVLLCSLLFYSAPAASASKTLRCDLCGITIDGTYYSSGERVFCKRCKETKPACASCGLPMNRSGHTSPEGDVCKACASKLDACEGCGQVLLGKYLTNPANPGHAFCEQCVKTKPVCSRCGLPVAGLRTVGEERICVFCTRVVDRCSVCNEPILGKYYSLPYEPGKFCATCHARYSQCDFCGKPIGEDGVSLPDSRHSCGACNAAAVTQMGRALDLAAETIRFLEDDLGLKVEGVFELVLVGRHDMIRLSSQSETLSMRELGLFRSKMSALSPRPGILLLDNLPEAAFLETFAHEYAHLWQFQANPDLPGLQQSEGFAQWVASKWLRQKKLATALARLEARNDLTYGTGYRIMADIEKSKGKAAVLSHVRTHSSLGKARQGPIATLDDPDCNAILSRTGMLAITQVLSANRLHDTEAYLQKAVIIKPSVLRKRASSPTPAQ